MVEVAFPSGASVSLPARAEVDAVLWQHLHIGVTRFEGEILAQAEIGLIEVAIVFPDGLRLGGCGEGMEREK